MQKRGLRIQFGSAKVISLANFGIDSQATCQGCSTAQQNTIAFPVGMFIYQLLLVISFTVTCLQLQNAKICKQQGQKLYPQHSHRWFCLHTHRGHIFLVFWTKVLDVAVSKTPTPEFIDVTLTCVRERLPNETESSRWKRNLRGWPKRRWQIRASPF